GHTYKISTKDAKRNSLKSNITDYNVRFSYLGFAIRSQFKLAKIIEDIISFFETIGVMLNLGLSNRKKIILIYSNEVLPTIPVYFIARLFKIKVISFVYEFVELDDIKRMNIVEKLKSYSFLVNHNYLKRFSNKLIVFSSFLKNDFIKRGFNSSQILIQPNLTDLEGWSIPETPIKYTIGYAGTPSRKDGILDLLDAIKILKDEYPNITLLIAGD